MQGIFEYAFGEEFEELEATVMKNLQEDRGIQNIFTPIKDIEKATNFKFSSVLNKNTKNIGIFFNTEFVRYILKSFDEDYLNNVKITFFYDSQFDKKEVERIKVEYKYKQDIELISIEDFTEENKDIKVIVNAIGNKKFDVVFSNPPYGDSNDTALDLKIIECIPANIKVILQPAGWIYADKSAGKAKTWTDKLGKYITDVYFCDFNTLMDIKIKTYGGIVIYNYSVNFPSINVYNSVTKEQYIASNIYNLTKFGSNYEKLVKPFKEYIETYYKDFIANHIEYKVNSNFPIRFSMWCGHQGKDDFYCPINKTDINNHIITTDYIIPKQGNTFKDGIINDFNNMNECFNFLNCWKTKVYRFCFALNKNNINFLHGNPTKLVPWMDFSRTWNDKDLCQEFNINEELWRYIDKFIPDYYDDYKSGF